MREKLSKMLVVMLRPSMHEAAEKRASSRGLNVSEYIRALIEADLMKKGVK